MTKPISVFLSHTHADKPFAKRLGADLATQGLAVWFDEWSIKPGESISRGISKGLLRYDIFVIVLTPKSVKSSWVLDELGIAIHRRAKDATIRTIPVLRKKCQLPEFLRDYKYVDFSKATNYKKSLNELCDAIVFDQKLLPRYRKLYPGGMLIDSVKVVATLSGPEYGGASFKEDLRFRAVKSLGFIRKEIDVDGVIEKAGVEGGRLKRACIRKNAERWTISFQPKMKLAEPGHLVLRYLLRDEFTARRIWTYDIESPVRHFGFDWLFTLKNAPRSVRCVERRTPTPVARRKLTKTTLASRVRFSLAIDYPSLYNRFEFTW